MIKFLIIIISCLFVNYASANDNIINERIKNFKYSKKAIREINKSDRAYQVSYGQTEKAHFPAILIQEDGSVTASRLPMKEHLEDATSPDYYQVLIKRDHQTVSEINRKKEEESSWWWRD